MITKSNSRKSLALALGIVGVAGLSMASAANLPVTSNEIAAGSDQFADCDADGVTVSYGTPTFTGGEFVVDEVTIGDLDGTCSGVIYVQLLDDSATPVPLTDGDGSVAYPGSGTTATVSLAGDVAVADIYGAAVAIG